MTTLVLVPRLMDVCGSPAPDVTATFTSSDSGGTMQIRKLPQAADVLPLKIEAVIRDPRGPASSAVAFGYDARGGGQAPESFRAALSLTGAGDSTTTALNLTISGAGPTLAVTSEAFTRAPGGSRTNPQRLRLGYAPVPGSATVTVRPAGDGFSLRLGAATPTSVTMLAETLTATSQRTLTAAISPLPTSLTLGFTETGGGALTYAASAPVELLTLDASDSAGLVARANRLELALRQLPTALNLGFDQPGAAFSLDAGTGTLGTVQALLTSGPTESLAEDGVRLVDTAAQYTLCALLTGVRQFSVRQRPTIEVQLDTTGGRSFGVDLRQSEPDQTLMVRVPTLPAILSLAFAETAAGHRQLTSQSSSVTGQIVLDATGVPLTGRVKRVAVVLQAVPTSLTLDFGAEGGSLAVDTAGAVIGVVEALLTSGPSENIPAGTDGVTLVDDLSRYTLAMRAAGLRRATATQNPLQVSLDATGNRPFRLSLRQQTASGQKLTFTDLVVNTLQRNTRLALTDTGARTELSYAADNPAGRLDLATNSGTRQQLALSATGPVPAALTVCFDPAGNVCGNTSRPANKGSLRVSASAPMAVDLFDCRAGSCSAPDRQLRLTNLRVRKLELNVHTEAQCVPIFGCGLDGGKGSVWLDTDSTSLTGAVFADDVSQAGTGAEVTVRFPPGFSAENRFVTWDGPFTDTQGAINCDGTPGDGQDLDFDVEPIGGITVDLAFLLC